MKNNNPIETFFEENKDKKKKFDEGINELGIKYADKLSAPLDSYLNYSYDLYKGVNILDSPDLPMVLQNEIVNLFRNIFQR